jgi:hypothetical protein
VNEGHRAIEVGSTVTLMRVEWMELWTLFPVRYTCFILVYFIALKRPSLVRVIPWRLFLNLAVVLLLLLLVFLSCGGSHTFAD